jgi:hypothetical protein
MSSTKQDIVPFAPNPHTIHVSENYFRVPCFDNDRQGSISQDDCRTDPEQIQRFGPPCTLRYGVLLRPSYGHLNVGMS